MNAKAQRCVKTSKPIVCPTTRTFARRPMTARGGGHEPMRNTRTLRRTEVRLASIALAAALSLSAALPASALLGLDQAALIRAEIALAIGTPGLAALAVAVAAVTAGLPRASSLAGLLLLPLAVPLLIFGAADALLLEAAVSLLLTAGAPFVAGAAIRASRT